MIFFLVTYYFNGVERWQLWFDNPNKAAILLVELIILSIWLLCRKGNLSYFCGLILMLISMFSMFHTLSRGGYIACCVGISFAIRKGIVLSRNKKIFLVTAVVVLALAAVYLGVHRRCAHGIVDKDISIQNRFNLWSSASKMFYAAPSGWGLGTSGDAYMNWFQSLDSHEKYRTLVNSHLTWIVEFGWCFGWFYFWAWGTVLVIGWKIRKSIDGGLLIGEYACLFVGGFFSSVLESLWVWIVPITTLATLARIVKRALLPNLACFLKTGILSLMLICGLLISSFAEPSYIKKSHAKITIGTGKPIIALYPDEDVLGGKNYGRELRNAIKKHGGSVHVFTEDIEIPVVANLIVLCGRECAKVNLFTKAYPNKKILLISPSLESESFTAKSTNIHLWIGDLSEAVAKITENETQITVFPGVDRYIPQWADMMFVFGKNHK